MPAHSRPKDGVAALAYVAGIHALLGKREGVDAQDLALPSPSNKRVVQVGWTRLADDKPGHVVERPERGTLAWSYSASSLKC